MVNMAWWVHNTFQGNCREACEKMIIVKRKVRKQLGWQEEPEMMVGGKKIVSCDLKLGLDLGGMEGGCQTYKIRWGGFIWATFSINDNQEVR